MVTFSIITLSKIEFNTQDSGIIHNGFQHVGTKHNSTQQCDTLPNNIVYDGTYA